MCRDLCHSDLHVPVDLHITNQQRMPLDLHVLVHVFHRPVSHLSALRTNIDRRLCPPAKKSRPLRRQKEGQGRHLQIHLQIVCCANTPRTKYYVARVCARPIIDAFIGLKSVSAKSYHRGATKFPSVLSTGVSRVWRCVQWMKSLAARVLLHVLLPHWRCLLKERVSAEILCSVDVCASRPRSFSLFSDSFMH